MNLHVMSDLHFESKSRKYEDFFKELEKRAPEADALVLAGDIGSLRPGLSDILLENLTRFDSLYKKVFYVPGNHEFWGTSISRGKELLSGFGNYLKNTSILGLSEVKYNELSFNGDTLWFPDCEDELIKRRWSDFENVDDGEQGIYEEHKKFLGMATLPDVMVTHHLPTAESISEKWKGYYTNVFFCANLGDWIIDKKLESKNLKPKLWIHGHSHDPKDFESLLDFRVYANPLGYSGEKANPDFWNRILIKV